MIDWFQLSILLIGGLVLFLHGLAQLSKALRSLSGEKVKRILHHVTGNQIYGLLLGAVGAVLVGSSSATIIIVIGFVRAGQLPFDRGLPVVLGANIGTTFKSFVISLHVTDWAPFCLLIGFLLRQWPVGTRLRLWGQFIFAIGLIFFALFLLGHAVGPLREDPSIRSQIAILEQTSAGVLFGCICTAIIQSSSAMMGIAITMAKEGLITLKMGLGIMMGAEIGTCADTLMASLGRDRAALRTGVFQLGYNVASVLIWLPFIDFMSRILTIYSPEPSAQLAAGHILLNVSTALVAMLILRPIARLLVWAIPDAAEKRVV